MPAGLLPFSYESPPGWTRRIIKAPNGGVDWIAWTGRLAPDGFVEFSFLAGTPERPGILTFKALQTYADGAVVRWIGGPGSDQPAPVTRIETGAPVQNAGGEGAAKPTDDAGSDSSAAAAPTRAGGHDTLALALGAVGLLCGITALTLSLLGRHRTAANR